MRQIVHWRLSSHGLRLISARLNLPNVRWICQRNLQQHKMSHQKEPIYLGKYGGSQILHWRLRSNHCLRLISVRLNLPNVRWICQRKLQQHEMSHQKELNYQGKFCGPQILHWRLRSNHGLRLTSASEGWTCPMSVGPQPPTRVEEAANKTPQPLLNSVPQEDNDKGKYKDKEKDNDKDSRQQG